MPIQGLVQQHINAYLDQALASVGDGELLEACISKYSKPEGCCATVCYVIDMICDAIKSIFVKTLWQETVATMTAHTIKQSPHANIGEVNRHLEGTLRWCVAMNESENPEIPSGAFDLALTANKEACSVYEAAMDECMEKPTDACITSILLPMTTPLKITFACIPGMTDAHYQVMMEPFADHLKALLTRRSLTDTTKQAILAELATLHVRPFNPAHAVKV